MTTPEDRIELVFNGLKRKRQLPDSIGELEHFPFTDFADVKSRINDGEYIFLRGVITPSLFDVLASKTEKLVHTLSALAYVLGALILLVGSFIVDNLYLLLGYLLFPLLLLFTTNQLEKMARFVLIVLVGGLAIAVASGNADLLIVLLSFFLWLFGHLKLKATYYRTLCRQALNNEKAFILAIWSRFLSLADKTMTEVWAPPEPSQV